MVVMREAVSVKTRCLGIAERQVNSPTQEPIGAHSTC